MPLDFDNAWHFVLRKHSSLFLKNRLCHEGSEWLLLMMNVWILLKEITDFKTDDQIPAVGLCQKLNNTLDQGRHNDSLLRESLKEEKYSVETGRTSQRNDHQRHQDVWQQAAATE